MAYKSMGEILSRTSPAAKATEKTRATYNFKASK